MAFIKKEKKEPIWIILVQLAQFHLVMEILENSVCVGGGSFTQMLLQEKGDCGARLVISTT